MTATLRLISPPSEQDPVEAELAKDIWDVRNLPGVRYCVHKCNHLLNFTTIPLSYRATIKRYFRFLLTPYSWSECQERLHSLRLFLDFYAPLYPDARDFQKLSRADIETYLLHLKARINARGKPTSTRQIWNAVNMLKYFLEYLERTDSPESSRLPVSKLIWPSDGGKCPQATGKDAKYIPEMVLQQLELHMHNLPPTYLPVVILLRASGWRISDVLTLRYDACLEQSASGFWLCGDIMKTQVLGHKIPISDEIAAFVMAQRELVKEKYPEQINPHHYLFPATTKQRQGRPLYEKPIRDALNRLAGAHAIQDEQGTTFHFATHAFRHTKAVELINNGMSLLHVQKWLAHLTPEMTLVYAKILDSTMRKEWEQAFAKGAVRIDVAGRPKVVNTEQLSNEQELELEHIRHNLDAVRLADGYCFKPKKANCPTQDSPCYTCHHFCTTPDFLPEFEKQEQGLRELIDLGGKAGSAIWVERNTQKLNKVLPLIQVLRRGDLHHPAGKAMREYTPEERTKQA